MYFACFIAKMMIGLVAVVLYADRPESKQSGIFAGIALGITMCQYLAHYFW